MAVLARVDERSLIDSASLIYHELVPGHHFQLSLDKENEELPHYRRANYHDAFVEGWAEYASTLAGEIGMYEDPYDLYGRLAAESFYASRLASSTAT